MTHERLVAALFNLGAHSDFLNSKDAARDFWLVFAVAAVCAIAYFTLRTARRNRRRGRPFGHSL